MKNKMEGEFFMRKSKQEKKENNYNQPKSKVRKNSAKNEIQKRGVVYFPKSIIR